MLRPCLQFYNNGCENCNFLRLENDQERCSECTTPNFQGLISFIDPPTSWTAKWTHSGNTQCACEHDKEMSTYMLRLPNRSISAEEPLSICRSIDSYHAYCPPFLWASILYICQRKDHDQYVSAWELSKGSWPCSCHPGLLIQGWHIVCAKTLTWAYLCLQPNLLPVFMLCQCKQTSQRRLKIC